MAKRALITGICGQDGFFLTRLLLEKGYQVYGVARRNSQMSLGNLALLSSEERSAVSVEWGDVTDTHFIYRLIQRNKFDEIYHLAAQSYVGLSFENPQYTYDVNIGGTLNILNAVHEHSPESRIYFAATSEMFGASSLAPQSESTPFYPRSPYAISKLAGFWTCRNYREAYNLFVSSGILFNHESELRGPEFVTRKVSMAVARIATHQELVLELGNLNAQRDWGFAGDYMEGVWCMLQQPKPDDFVLATGRSHTVRELVTAAFQVVGISLEWVGSGTSERGVDQKTGRTLVRVSESLFRPTDVELLTGNSAKAFEQIGWKAKVAFEDLVRRMVLSDLDGLHGEQPHLRLHEFDLVRRAHCDG